MRASATTSCSSSANETSGIGPSHVHGEVDARLLLAAEREVVVDRRAVEPLEEQLLEPLAQLGVEAVARQGDERRETRSSSRSRRMKSWMSSPLLEIDQPDERLPQLVGAAENSSSLGKDSKSSTSVL